MKKVVLLFGGESLEHEVSLSSAQSILENIDTKKYQIFPVLISKQGKWYLLEEENFSIPFSQQEAMEEIPNILSFLQEADIIFPMIHGAYGEDGRLQGFLELFHIPYIGCDSKTSMICMDKEFMKQVAKENNIPIVPYSLLTPKNRKDIKNFPVIVKPANGGSSIGIGVAYRPKELLQKYKAAYACDSKVIVEKYIHARELEVAVLISRKKQLISSIGEILTNQEFYSYDRKYVNSLSTTTKATLSKQTKKEIYDMVRRIIEIYSLKGFARIDFFYEEETGKIYFNEVNTIPGFTTISMYPKLFEEIGIPYSKLLSFLLESN